MDIKSECVSDRAFRVSFRRSFSFLVFQAEQYAAPEVCALHRRPLSLPLQGAHLPRRRIQRSTRADNDGRSERRALRDPPSLPNVNHTSAVARRSMLVYLLCSAYQTGIRRKHRRRANEKRSPRRAKIASLCASMDTGGVVF